MLTLSSAEIQSLFLMPFFFFSFLFCSMQIAKGEEKKKHIDTPGESNEQGSHAKLKLFFGFFNIASSETNLTHQL